MELQEDEYLEYWATNRLPHPGCPISFKLLIEGVHLFHTASNLTRREQAFKELAGVVRAWTGSFNGKIEMHWPLQDKLILVPMDVDHLSDVNEICKQLNNRMKGDQP